MIPNIMNERVMGHVQWELIIYHHPEGVYELDNDTDLDYGDKTTKISNLKPETLQKALKKIDAWKSLKMEPYQIINPTVDLETDFPLGMIELENSKGHHLGRFQAITCDNDYCKTCI